MSWIKDAPVFLLFCGDIRRGRRLCELQGREHANDSVDTFINATADAALAMAHLILAADAAGLGTCPISYVRNHVEKVGPLCGLPKGVFPVAGLTLGCWFSTRDTVWWETPASRATSFMTAARPWLMERITLPPLMLALPRYAVGATSTGSE